MSEKNHFAALQEIRSWNTDDVICALKNNGLAECVDVCKKRDITGEKLLELSEMKLGLWKRDLTIVNIRKLAAFIQDISKMPAKYSVCGMSSNSDDAWDTDFDDDDEIEEDSSQKTEINIPNGVNLERKLSSTSISYQTNGNLSVQNLVNKNYNIQHDNRLSPINRHSTSQQRNKINIPSAFASDCTSQNGSITNLSIGNVTKPPFLKANGITEPDKKDESRETSNIRPTIPSRPPSLYTKSSPLENTRSTLPKPPAFDNEGSVLREICDKLSMEHDLMDEYESIDDELLHAKSTRSQTPQPNGVGSSSISVNQNVVENLRKSPVPHGFTSDSNQQVSPMSSLHRNQLYISQKINSLAQQFSKTDQDSVVENIRKSPVLPSGHAKKQEGTVQPPKSTSCVNKEKVESLRRSPVPLPPRNEVKHESPSSSMVPQSHQMNSLRFNETSFTDGNTVISKLCKEFEEGKQDEIKHENGINEHMHSEEVYESIPEHVSTHCKRAESCEYSEGYLLPKAPPSLPPKYKPTLSNTKSPSKTNKTESNGTSGSLWPFGSQKHKSQQIVHQEKSPQDGKKNNTLPMPRPMNSYVSEAPRPSASRPLPPPPPDGGVQRVIKIPLVKMPWYFNVDRARGEDILRNCEDGTFMIRPSTKTQNGLTLTLKYGKRPFNISVRLRPDGKFALGTAKPTEQTFTSVEELVNHYMSNELLLYSNGKQAGIVVLTSPPRKDQLSQ